MNYHQLFSKIINSSIFLRGGGILIFLSILPTNCLAQTIQQPYWILGGNPPTEIKNITTALFPALPFTTPTSGLNLYSERQFTSCNGVFDECGDPIFYVAGDWVFDSDGNEIGYLEQKDWESKNDIYSSDKYRTDNFEQVICPIPDANNQYFIFSVDQTLGKNMLYVSEYDAVSNVLTHISKPILTTIHGGGLRLALSFTYSNGDRHLYARSIGGLYRIEIPASTSSHEDLTTAIVRYDYPAPNGPEMEISHDGKTIAWIEAQGAYNAILFYDIPNQTLTYFEPAPGAMKRVKGLEFLPDGRLAVSIEWNNPLFQSLNGIGVFNLGLTNFTHIPNTGPYYSGMIELGVSLSNYWSLYGNSGSSLCRIQISSTTNGVLTHTYAHSSVALTSALYPIAVNVSGALPDQADGEYYPFSAECEGTGSEFQASQENATEYVRFENETKGTTISFSPILRVVN